MLTVVGEIFNDKEMDEFLKLFKSQIDQDGMIKYEPIVRKLTEGEANWTRKKKWSKKKFLICSSSLII